jgi:hypothetical protein
MRFHKNTKFTNSMPEFIEIIDLVPESGIDNIVIN